MDEKPALGEQQMQVLNFIVENAPVTVSEAARSIGESHGLARTTVLTVMEKLREKGYLVRVKNKGVWAYYPSENKQSIHRGIIDRFVDKALGGSVVPVLMYLKERAHLSDEEVKDLLKRLDELDG